METFNQEKTEEHIIILEYYIDLGKTGSDFEREAFLRMLQDIRLGKINCVIVKDLSRFGRNYLETGNYIEKIFPFLGVRFIAVADEFDTGEAGNENKHMIFEIKNLINDIYAKDISKKAKIQLKQRREEGSYVGGTPPYGYKISWKQKKRILVPDANTAKIVPLIYQKFIETKSDTAVANYLNQRNINPPAVYQKTGEVYHISQNKEYKKWNKSTVQKILKSGTYLGILIQGKSSMTGKNRINKPEQEWSITQNAHEALIDRELYLEAAKIRGKINKKSSYEKHGNIR